jgi:ribosomal protein S9
VNLCVFVAFFLLEYHPFLLTGLLPSSAAAAASTICHVLQTKSIKVVERNNRLGSQVWRLLQDMRNVLSALSVPLKLAEVKQGGQASASGAAISKAFVKLAAEFHEALQNEGTAR